MSRFRLRNTATFFDAVYAAVQRKGEKARKSRAKSFSFLILSRSLLSFFSSLPLFLAHTHVCFFCCALPQRARLLLVEFRDFTPSLYLCLFFFFGPQNSLFLTGKNKRNGGGSHMRVYGCAHSCTLEVRHVYVAVKDMRGDARQRNREKKKTREKKEPVRKEKAPK